MIIGVPKEIKTDEYRVSITPAGVAELVKDGHILYVQKSATLYSSSQTIASLVKECDIIVGTVLIPGAKAPKLITKAMIKEMKQGSVLVDVSIDQGGCFESSRPTTHTHPTFIEDGVVHYCVANMPGAYPSTSTYALTNATLKYVKALAKFTAEHICTELPVMQSALNTYDGVLYNKAVGQTHGIETKEKMKE